MPGPTLPSSKDKVEKLGELLSSRTRALILLHDGPDPDAMAGALCLYRLIEALWQTETHILHGGVVGRAENRYMARKLSIPLETVDSVETAGDDALIMVDTQPGFANNSSPEDLSAAAVIDHHEPAGALEAPLVDLRPEYGAVTTILTEYLVSAEVEMDVRLATALCYGIASETQDLGREAAEADIAAFLEAFPRSDQRLLGRLHHPQRPAAFFATLKRGLDRARVAENLLICHLTDLGSGATAAEMADTFIAVEGIEWVLCTGVSDEKLVLSLRTTRRDARAGDLLREVVGTRSLAGGHDMIAGGAVPLEEQRDIEQIRADMDASLMEALGLTRGTELKPLMQEAGGPAG